jgi:long-chain acyl-CoA synthetase
MIFQENLTVGNAWKNSSETNSELPFTTSINGKSFSYAEAAGVVSRISAFLSEKKLKKGDKVAIISENRAEWGLCWLGITTMGCVAVPIMIDFPAEQMLNILEHAEADFVFASEKLISKITESKLVKKHNFKVIDNDPIFSENSGLDEYTGDIKTANSPEDVAALIYTSGTTGMSKGVLLSHKNIMTNAWDSIEVGHFKSGDSMLSLLPLAHMYEFTQGFILPMITGANITYLGLKPTPRLMMEALKTVRPHFILSVPLLIEKIYKSSVMGPISKSKVLNTIYKIPVIRKLLNRFVIGKKLLVTFGGRLKFFGIGGAPLSDKVEKFLREAAFPYAVGYGLTETAPVLAGSAAFETVYRGIGPRFEHVTLRISPEGEIQATGDSIMIGYYKDEERTAEVFTEDGWFKTGDLGSIDAKGNLFIKGRLKNMILGPSGENIYPEEIENELKANQFISDCLVLKNKLGLVARVLLDEEKLKLQYEELKHNMINFPIWKKNTMEDIRKSINKQLSSFSKVNSIIEQEIPFELTPSLKIKRFLYK